MDAEAASIYATATNSFGIILEALTEWTDLLEGTERDEALFHIQGIAEAWNRLALAIADYEGIELWNIPDIELVRQSVLATTPNPEQS